jgi:hypothetical protein
VNTDEKLDLVGLGAEKWNFEACRLRLRAATTAVFDAEDAYKSAIERSADAENFYRVELAKAFEAHRQAGQAVEAATTLARRDVAVHGRERDYAAGLVKLRADQVDDARDSRRSVWRLIEWARAVSLAQLNPPAAADERIPAGQWPT